MAILTEPTCPELWRAGRITGWMEALMETAPQTFRSALPEELWRDGQQAIVRPFP